MPWSAIGALALASLTTWLGFWQLNRAQEKTEIGERLEQMREAPAISVAPGETNAGDYTFRRVEADGVFDPASTIYLDNKIRQGIAGYEVVSLLKMKGGRKPVLVNRGWLPQSGNRLLLPEVVTPQGEVRIRGMASVPSERVLELSEKTIEGRLWQNLNLKRYREWYGSDVQPFIILQESDSADGLTRDWKTPDAGADKHRAYAVQWFALAVLTVIFYFAVGRKRKRSGREKLLLMLAFLALPVVAATFAFNYWRPSSLTNYGDLLPPRQLPDFALTTINGDTFRLSDMRGKWTLMMVDSGACAEPCRDKLYKMRQLRLTQGKNKDRMARVWLISDAATPSANLKQEY